MLNPGRDTVPTQPVSRFQRLLRLPLARRLLRYCGASAVSTTIGLVVLATLVATGALTAGWANVVATAVGTGPSFELNRRWVWGRTGRRSVRAEVLPFAALSFASLGVSTLAVSLATGWADRTGLSGPLRVSVALGANLASFGTMWVVQYLLLDRLLFRSGSQLRQAAEPEGTEFLANSKVALGSLQGQQPRISAGSDHLKGRPMQKRETPRRDARRRSLKRSRTITGVLAGGSMLGMAAVVGVVAAESGTTHHSASAAATSSSTGSSGSTSSTNSTSSSSNSSSSSSNNVGPTASSGPASVSSGAS